MAAPVFFDAFPDGLNLPAGFRNFIASLLADIPAVPPEADIKEWHDLLDCLDSHGIMPILYWQIMRQPSPTLHPPGEVMDELRWAFHSRSARSLQVAKQIKKIVAAFNEQGVDLLVLKGAAFAYGLYPHPATRPHVDIDLLTKPNQIPRARSILKGLGYRCQWEMYSAASAGLYKHEVFHPATSTPNCKQVELHWNFDVSSGLLNDTDADTVFSRAVEVSSELNDGLTFNTLSPVDCLLAVAIHMGIHSSVDPTNLVWIYDIALLAEKLKAADDWAALQERSVAWKGRIPVERALKSAVKWVEIDIPPPFDDFSGWPRPHDSEYRLLSRKRQLKAVSNWTKDSPVGGLRKAATFAGLLFPPPSHIRANYPPAHPWLLPLSYMRRWRKWAGRLGS